MKYNPKQGRFPGDDMMRAVTKMPRAIRDHASKRKMDQVTAVQVRKEKRMKKGRLSGDLGKLCDHVSAIVNLKKPCVCAYCGALSYHACGIYVDKNKKPIALHYNSKQKESKGKLCFYHWHDD